MLNYLRARINGSSPSLRRVVARGECPIFFLQGASINVNASTKQVETAAERITKYEDFLKKGGFASFSYLYQTKKPYTIGI